MSVRFARTGSYVDLPNPTLGDADQHNIFTQFHVSMGKTVYSTKKTPPRSSLILTFVDVKKQTYDAFLTWYASSRGYQITYTDYDSVSWTGIIKNQPIEVTVTGRKVCPPPTLGALRREVATFTVDFEAEHS